MASYTAIAAVSQALLDLLRDRFAARDELFSMDENAVSLVAPDAVGDDSETRLSVSLYRLEENASMKNAEPKPTADPTVSHDPPLALDLYYLVTAYPDGRSTDTTAATVDQQRVLGAAMQTFHDNAVLDADQLHGSLAADVDLQISLVNQSVEELTALWTTVSSSSLQPSAVYHVGPVLIDSQSQAEVTPVTERQTSVDRTPDR